MSSLPMSSRIETPNPENKAMVSQWYVLVVAVFITTLIAANITSVKLIDLWGLVLPAGIVIFPVSYICGDVLTEVYGYSRARRVIWLGFCCNLLMVGVIWAGQVIPPAPFWEGQEAYERILGYAPRLLAASFLAYLTGEFVNAYVMAKMKIATGGRWLWMRTIASTLLGQGIDSLVFISVAFGGVMPPRVLVTGILTQWLSKSVYEALATPFTYLGVGFLKAREGLDVYDHHTRFNPLDFNAGK